MSEETYLNEKEEISSLLGWRVKHFKPTTRLKRINYGTIYKTKNNITLALEQIPELTLEEAELISQLFETFIQQVGNNPFEENELETSRRLETLLKEYCDENLVELDAEQNNYLLELLKSTVIGYGPLDYFLNDQNLEEIAIIGLEKPVYLYHNTFGWMQTNVYLQSEKYVTHIVNKMSRNIGRRLTLQNPALNACLENGSRLHAVNSSIAFTGPAVTIRKFREKPFSPAELAKLRTISTHALAYLWAVLQNDVNVVVAGNTGSGKTTTLNALLSFIPLDERIIITEETPEINAPHEHAIKLRVDEGLGITMSHLVENTLRMRPDRVIVGEVRNKTEVKAFLNTTLAGQGKGSIATYHAQTAKDVLQRMSTSIESLKDLENVNLIIVQRRWTKRNAKQKTELRRVIEISEVVPSPNASTLPTVKNIYTFDYSKDKLIRTKNQSALLKQISKTNCISEKQVQKQIRDKEKTIQKTLLKKTTFKEFLKVVKDVT